MLELAEGLTETQLAAIAGLESRAVRHDGGRLKLEWGTLRHRAAGHVNDLLWWEGGTLVGFLGLYGFGGASLELTGMVDPAWRRRGIGSALLARGMEVASDRDSNPPLMIVPRTSEGGHALARSSGATLRHSEHALVLTEPPEASRTTDGVPRPDQPAGSLALDGATAADLDTLSALMLEAFGNGEIDPASALDQSRSRTLMLRLGAETVGTIRLSLEGDRGAVYGFVIAREHRGKGLGRQVLQRACHDLFKAGATTVALEVAVDNERALGLYTGLGFVPVSTEDYYALPVPRPKVTE